MDNKIIVPDKIKVGFQNRSDTYTGKLAYLIFNDGKIWRKENSWNSWRDKNIEPIEYENGLVENLVLNKKVGDYSSGWNHRRSYIRIYDPRGFEFEISVDNLLYVLENCNSIKGKYLEGFFKYGWHGKDLVLIPESSPDYQEMVEYTNLQELKLKKSDLIPGGMYKCSDNEVYTYLCNSNYYDKYWYEDKGKKLWFTNKQKSYYGPNTGQIVDTFLTKGIDSVKKFVGMNDDYPFLMDGLSKVDEFIKPSIDQFKKIDKLYLENYLKMYPVNTSYYFYSSYYTENLNIDVYKVYNTRKGETIKKVRYFNIKRDRYGNIVEIQFREDRDKEAKYYKSLDYLFDQQELYVQAKA